VSTVIRVALGLLITIVAVSVTTSVAVMALAAWSAWRSGRAPADAQAIQDADEQACALTRPDDPLEVAWALPAYQRPTRTAEDTR
jgi:hypothetical protein